MTPRFTKLRHDANARARRDERAAFVAKCAEWIVGLSAAAFVLWFLVQVGYYAASLLGGSLI